MGMINAKSKKQKVLDALKTGEPVTALNLAHYAGTLHVSQIISVLKAEGFDITSTIKRDLDGDRYVSYQLKLDPTTGNWKQPSLPQV